MKKLMALLLALLCALALAGCAEKSVSVFETEQISRIVFYEQNGAEQGAQVPKEYLEEIIAWLGTFRIGEKVKGEALKPGSNSIFVRIEYADGSIVENGLDTVKADGITYYTERADAPACWFSIFSN